MHGFPQLDFRRSQLDGDLPSQPTLATMGFFGTIFTMILAEVMVVATIAATLPLTMPIVGALQRLRANYNPRGFGLDGQESSVGPRLTGIIDTLTRTKRLEGWYGLYKGVFASFITGVLTSSVAILLIGGGLIHASKTDDPTDIKVAGGFAILIGTLIMGIVNVPASIIVNRSIITPYRLPNNIRESLRILLSPHELERPFRLFLTPGMMTGVALRCACIPLMIVMRRLLAGNDLKHASFGGLFAFAIFQALSALWLTPIDVVVTKLSVQPNQGGEVSVEDPDGDTPEGLRFAGTDEDVVGLRPTTDPYTGFRDAVQKIIAEEGWQSLYRGWWWTSIAAVATAVHS